MKARREKRFIEITCDCGFKTAMPTMFGVMDVTCVCGKEYTAREIKIAVPTNCSEIGF